MGKFLVCENTPGCLPESEPSEFDTMPEAVQDALSRVRELREAGYKVKGSSKVGEWYAERHKDDLGRVITIERV